MSVERIIAGGERLVVLVCPWKHVTLWYENTTPLPTQCPNKVASTDTGWPLCGKDLTLRGVVEAVSDEVR